MKIPLQLRQCEIAAGSPDAWFVPGADVAHWLEVLAEGNLAEKDTSLFVIPRSQRDRSPAGVLAVSQRAPANKSLPGAIPCQAVAKRLYIPVDAQLLPPVTDAELRELLPASVSFFHPTLGLSSFETPLRIWDLLEVPEERAALWNRAQPGADPIPELSAIVLAVPPSIGDLFGDAPDEIGNDPLTELSATPDEPKNDPLSRAGRKLKQMMARGVSNTLKGVPRTAKQRTWVNGLEDWAKEKLQGVQKNLDQLRNKELHRLLHLLESDPDKGLRHAIPFAGGSHRGVASPGANLGDHSIDFDLSRLGGGRPADFWSVPHHIQERLIQRYRQLANRELQLGRYRRAAYIYAELLGDLLSAASALKQGHLYREAAIIYEEHQHNPLEAARCLAEGGFYDEAIQRYEKLQRWLDIADLHERLGDLAAAEAALQRVVAERIQQDDIVGAATLVEERLRKPEEALEILDSAWPNSRQSANAVDALFKLMGKLGRHDDALLRLARFSTEPLPQQFALPLLNALGNCARDYPDRDVRHNAADLSRVLISTQLNLARVSVDQVATLMSCLTRLAPEDRLLTRDTNRYLANRREGELKTRRTAPVRPTIHAGKAPVVLRHFELPRQIQWVQLRTEGPWFFAAGITSRRLTLLRGVWYGEFQSLSWDCDASRLKDLITLQPTREQGTYVAVDAHTEEPFPEKSFPAADSLFNQGCTAGTPSWLQSNKLTFAYGEDLVFVADVANERIVVSAYNKRGALLDTYDVSQQLLDRTERLPSTEFSLLAVPQGFAVAWGNRLVIWRGHNDFNILDLPGQAVRLVGTPPHTRPAVVVCMDVGAAIHWLGSSECSELERDLAQPKAIFIPGGPLVLLSDLHVVILEVDSRGIHQTTRVQLSGIPPVAISATDQPNQFALLASNGQVAVYHFPR